MKASRKVAIVALLLFCFIATVVIVYGPDKSFSTGSGTVSYSGTNITINDTKNITIKLTNASNVQAVGGYWSVQDPSCVEVVKVSAASGVKYNDGNHKFALVSMDELSSGTTILTMTVKGLKDCSTKIVFSDAVVTSADEVPVNSVAGTSSGTITVKAPTTTTTAAPTTKAPSNNNNNGGNNTNTNTNTNNNKTTTTTKPTTTRSGSSNNYLNNLNVDGYSLTFNKNQEEYNLEVEEDVTSLNIKAKTEDTKANYTIKGNTELVKGKNIIKVIVEAENGSTRTYIINVLRKGEVEEVKGEEETQPIVEPEPEPPKPSTFLSSIKLYNGSLLDMNGKKIKNYDKNKTTYYYTKDSNFSYEFIKEYEDANMNIYETNDTITIIVSLSEEDYRVYTLVPYKKNNNVVLIISLFIIGIIIGFVFRTLLIKNNK